MSFINLAKSSFQNVTNNGRLIGTAKNSGIKVFERVEADGKRILTSFDKQGNMMKKVTREWLNPNSMSTKTENFITGAKTKSRLMKNYDETRVTYDYFKKTSDGGGESYLMQKELPIGAAGSEGLSLPLLRKNNPEIFQKKGNIEVVQVTQKTHDGAMLDVLSTPKVGRFHVSTSKDYKVADNFVMPNGYSKAWVSKDGSLCHAQNKNAHELNVLQSLYDGLKKLWS